MKIKYLLSLILIAIILCIFKPNVYAKYVATAHISIDKFKIEKIEKEDEIEYEKGVYAKLYDTNNDEIGDTIVLNDLPNFTYEGTLITDYDNEDNKSTGQNNSWYSNYSTYPSSEIKTFVILNEIKPTDTSFWFAKCDFLQEIENIEKINTSNVTDMSYMFFRCVFITELDVTSFNTSKVANMQAMFARCNNVSSLDLSNWDTSNVTNMFQMFYGCNSLSNLNLDGLHTINVTNMSRMFEECVELTVLNLRSFDTTNVSNMERMFRKCYKLKTIYATNRFNVDNVESSNQMFLNCDNLVGECGTIYQYNNSDKEYAKIDEGEINPGYFSNINHQRNNIVPDETTINEVIQTEENKEKDEEVIVGEAVKKDEVLKIGEAVKKDKLVKNEDTIKKDEPKENSEEKEKIDEKEAAKKKMNKKYETADKKYEIEELKKTKINQEQDELQ